MFPLPGLGRGSLSASHPSPYYMVDTCPPPHTPLAPAEIQALSFRQVRNAHRSELTEDYVELISDLIADGGEARQVDIAARLGVAQPTVARVLKRLARDGLLYPLMYDAFVDDYLATQGATAIAMLSAFMPEWHIESNRWIDAIIKTAAAESDENKQLLSDWYTRHADNASAALLPIAQAALGDSGATILNEIRTNLDTRVRKLGLDVQGVSA